MGNKSTTATTPKTTTVEAYFVVAAASSPSRSLWLCVFLFDLNMRRQYKYRSFVRNVPSNVHVSLYYSHRIVFYTCSPACVSVSMK